MYSVADKNHQGGPALTLRNVLGVLNVLNAQNVLNMLNMRMDASLACWALFFLSPQRSFLLSHLPTFFLIFPLYFS